MNRLNDSFMQLYSRGNLDSAVNVDLASVFFLLVGFQVLDGILSGTNGLSKPLYSSINLVFTWKCCTQVGQHLL